MLADVISIDSEVLGGTPVFKGTRVPVQILFDHLEEGISIDVFLTSFPTVSRDQVVAVLEVASKILSSKNLKQLYETAA